MHACEFSVRTSLKTLTLFQKMNRIFATSVVADAGESEVDLTEYFSECGIVF
jgi:hypothetical protein